MTDGVQETTAIMVQTSFTVLDRSSSRGFITARQRSYEKAMFSVMSVCPLGGSHVTTTHNVLDITAQPTPSPSPDMATPLALHPLLVTSGGHH